MPTASVFDTIRRTDLSGKKRREQTFAYLNRSARRGYAVSRLLIETWLSRVPAPLQVDFCTRFRCGREADFTSALQELTLHELLMRQGCKLVFHPNVSGTTKLPDFRVEQPGKPDFILEACTSLAIWSGPKSNPRANRIRDFLNGLDFGGHLICIDELTAGSRDLPQRTLERHIANVIGRTAVGYTAESITIPPLVTADGWTIRLTAFPPMPDGTCSSIKMMEASDGPRNGPSYPLRSALEKKGGRYGDQLAMPYVIAVNSSETMLTFRDLEETLFGAGPEAGAMDGRTSRGFWGTTLTPNYRRVSAVMFTWNLWPATLLMGEVYACLFLNPWAEQPYEGALTNLPTFRSENGTLRKYSGMPLHTLLKLRPRDNAMWS